MLPQWNTVFTELAVRYCCMQHIASVEYRLYRVGGALRYCCMQHVASGEYRLYRVGGALLLHATCCVSGIPPLQSWRCATVACNMLRQWKTAFIELVAYYCCMQHVA